MNSTALNRARRWAVGILSASTVGAGIAGYHLAEDHAAAVAAGTSSTTSTRTSTSEQQDSQDPSNQGATRTDRHSDEGGSGLFGDDHEGDDDGQSRQSTQSNPGVQSDQGTQSQNGLSSPGQLAPGSGSPQVTTHGS